MIRRARWEAALSATLTKTGVSLRYASEFKCIAESCPDSCCAGWRVALTGSDEVRLRAALARDERPADELVTRDELGARMKLVGSGSCAALSPEGLCTIQTKHGATAMPQICSTYPRQLIRQGDQIELTGTLSCPEMARLLFKDTRSTELVPMDTSPYRGMAVAEPPVDVRLIPRAVRDTMAVLLRTDGYPLHTRIFATSWLATRIGEVGTDDLDGTLAEAQEVVDDLHANLSMGMGRGPLGMNVLKTLVFGRLQHASHAPFRRMVVRSLEAYRPPGVPLWDPEDPNNLSLDRMTRIYTARRDLWKRLEPKTIDHQGTTFLINQWYSRSLGAPPSMVRHTQRILLRYALFRFFVFSHPDLDLGVSLQDIATDVAYNLARNVDHAHNFLARVEDLLDTGVLDPLEAMAALARF